MSIDIVPVKIDPALRNFAAAHQLDLMDECGQILFQCYGSNSSMMPGYRAFFKDKGSEWPELLPLRSEGNIYVATFPPGYFNELRTDEEISEILGKAMEAAHV